MNNNEKHQNHSYVIYYLMMPCLKELLFVVFLIVKFLLNVSIKKYILSHLNTRWYYSAK